MDILSPVSSARLALVRFPDHKQSISINKPFLGFPRNALSASDPFPTFYKGAKRCLTFVHAKLKADQYLACITSSVGVNPLSAVVRFPPSPVWSPLFWIGVGVGLAISSLYSWVVARLKMYAKQQALKTLAGQMNTKNYRSTLQKLFSIADDMLSSNKSSSIDIKDDSEPGVCSVVDVSPAETSQKKSHEESIEDAHVVHVDRISISNEKGKSPRAVEALEKVLGDPAVQTIAMDVIYKLFTAL